MLVPDRQVFIASRSPTGPAIGNTAHTLPTHAQCMLGRSPSQHCLATHLPQPQCVLAHPHFSSPPVLHCLLSPHSHFAICSPAHIPLALVPFFLPASSSSCHPTCPPPAAASCPHPQWTPTASPAEQLPPPAGSTKAAMSAAAKRHETSSCRHLQAAQRHGHKQRSAGQAGDGGSRRTK